MSNCNFKYKGLPIMVEFDVEYYKHEDLKKLLNNLQKDGINIEITYLNDNN